MAKRLNYQIGITADAGQFNATIQQAFQQLDTLGQRISIVPSLQQASAAALELKQNLAGAFNQDTGKLNLNAFEDNLNKSGKTLQAYYDQLSQLGPAGTEAFLSVAQSIASAELPLKRTNKLMNELWITMKNTMRWQLTSSALHGFVGQLETAYGYAKSLDSSLNNIRIVTSKTADDMKEFAEYANEAAKALSTTTTDYTDASLIYYQQGLDDEQVKGRTETTIKMANVSRQAGEEVSEQLTAVWNNFYEEGGKSLEYYADVMVALGAATASSSDEIATGLQKFAAVAGTVGLSYEYAASALATLTANTRESASIVGTALRTLFTRFQGLSLGETLEDGVDLNKYSQALAKVGVQILDANGNLKQMDNILDDTAERWSTLTKAQQMALAQTVAGVRQYTQFINLMENWGDFQDNLAIATGSSGALDEQADIYAESWEAARDRVRASAEDIYDSLINPDFYIGLDNVASPLLSIFADLIDGVGGLNGLLGITGLLMNKVYGDKIAQSMRDIANNIGLISNNDQARAQALRQQAIEQAKIIAEANRGTSDPRLKVWAQLVDLQGMAAEESNNLTESQRVILDNDMEHLKNLQAQVDLWTQMNEKATTAAQESADTAYSRIDDEDGWEDRVFDATVESAGRQIDRTNNSAVMSRVTDTSDEIMDIVLETRTADAAFDKLIEKFTKLTRKSKDLQAITDRVKALADAEQEADQEVLDLIRSFERFSGMSDSDIKDMLAVSDNQLAEELEITRAEAQVTQGALIGLGDGTNAYRTAVSNVVNKTIEAEGAMRAQTEAIRQEGIALDETADKLRNHQYTTTDWADTIVAVGSYLSALTMGINGMTSSIETLTDTDLSFFEKFTRMAASLPMLIGSITQMTDIATKVSKQSAAAATADAAAKGLLGKAAAAAAPKVAAFGATVQAALGPIMLIVSVASLVISAISGIAKAAKEAKEERLAAAKEVYNATKEEIEANESLIDSYKELLVTYEETGEGKQALNEAALEMAEALGIEGAAIANLTGDYSALNAEIEKTNTQRAQQTLNNAQVAKPTYAESFVDAMREGDGMKQWGDYVIDLGGNRHKRDAQSQALANSEFARKYMVSTAQTFNAEFEFSTAADADSLVAMYEAAQQAAEDMREAQRESGDEANKTYNQLVAWLAKSQEAYNEYKAILDESSRAAFKVVVAETGSVDDIRSYAEYLEYYNKLNTAIEDRIATGEIEESVATSLRDSYLAGAESIRKYVLQQQLLNELVERFGADFTSNDVVMESLSALNETNLAIAVSLIPQTGSIDEFVNLLERAVTDSLTEAAITSFQIMGALVQELNSNNRISSKEYETLQGDNAFMAQMQEDFNTFEDFQKQAQRVQIEYIRDYYTQVSQFAVEGLIKQEEQAQKEYAINLSKYNALLDLEENHTNLFNEMARLRGEYAQATSAEQKESLEADWDELHDKMSEEGIDIIFDIEDSEESLDVLDNNLQEIQRRIDEINQQKIEIAMDWSDFDDIKGQMDSLGDFASTMQKDAKKVGDSYQYPLDAVRDWMEIYPDLFKEASVTNQGLISLDREKVDSYISGKQDEVKENAEAKIKQWQLERDDLEVTRQRILAEKQAVEALEQGKVDISKMSNEQIANMAQQLTQYQIDCGVSEAEAQKNTLEAMGLNEEQYAQIVADVSETNAKNMTESSAEGAKNSISALEKLSLSIQAIGNNIKEAFKAFLDPTYEADYKSVWNPVVATSSFEGYTSDATFDTVDPVETDPIEAFKLQKLEQLNLDLSAIDEAIATIDSKILGAQAIQEIDNTYNGTEGPDTSGGDDKASQERFDEALERYHEITREIEYQERILSDLDKQIDRTYGLDRLELYQKKIEELNRLAELQSQKSMAALAFVAEDAAKLNELGLNPNIDQETLEISNYTMLLKQTQDEYKAFLANYNAMTKAEQEEAEEQKEAAKILYDKRIEALEAYENSVDTYREELEAMEDTLRSAEDAKLEAITTKLEVVIDAKELKEAYNDFAKTVAESFGDALTHGLKVAKLDLANAELEVGMLSEYQGQLAELQQRLSEANEYTDVTAIRDAIKDVKNQILSSAEAIAEWADTIENMIPDAVSAAADRFAQFTDQLDHNTSVLETIKELYALQGVTNKTDTGFATLQKNLSERLETQTANAVLQKSWADQAEQRLAQAQAELDAYIAAGGEENNEYDRLKKARDAYLEEFNEAQEAYLSLAQEAMETAQEMYLDQIENATYKFSKLVSGTLSTDWGQESYDRYIEEEERYLDEVNRRYEQNSWNNKLQQDIDAATTNLAKQRIKAFQEENKERLTGTKLSQYDLDILEAKYEVMQAQIALEEAQNAKNNLQLVRDRQGNWNYQYTADQDQIMTAEQNLLDAQNNWYNIAKERTKETTGEIIATWQECTEAIEQLYIDLANGDISYEEYLIKRDELTDYYSKKAQDLELEKVEAITDMNQAGQESLMEIAEQNGETVTSFKNLYAEKLEEMTASNDDFTTTLGDYIDECENYYDSYRDKVDTVAQETGTTLDELADETTKVSEATDELRNRGEEAAVALWAQVDATSALSAELSVLAQQYLELAQAMAQVAAEQNAMSGGGGTSDVLFNENVDYSALMSQYLQGEGHSINDDAYIELLKQRNAKIDYLESKGYTEDYWGTRGNETTDMFSELVAGGGDQDWYNMAGEVYSQEEFLKWLDSLKIPGFATGGYTGEFDNARLAFLHEKELVLNQEDTNNILAAVNAVRMLGPEFFAAIERALDSSVAAGIGLMKERISGSSSIQPVGDTLQQDVHIEAVFPNATDRNEIAEALSNLTNDASQYIRRRRD